MHLVRTDIMSLVSKAFIKGFTNVANNQKVIASRGWFPYNMNLLLNPTIRATMTNDMVEWELKCGLFPSHIIQKNQTLNNPIHNQGGISFSNTVVGHVDCNRCKLNLQKGALAKYVVDNIVSEVDRQEARERVLKRKQLGE